MKNSTLPRRWLITGGCGFIGTALIKRLKRDPDPVHIRVLDNLTVGTRDDLRAVTPFEEHSAPQPDSRGVELIVGDIRNAECSAACCQDRDVIVHLAANTGVAPSVEDPRLDMECNVVGTVNVLEGARLHNVPRFVFASSGAPIGEVTPPIHEELPPHPVSPYGASKLAGEGYCSAYSRTFGIETVALRFGNVYGPGSTHKSSVVAKFIRRAMAGEVLEIYGDGAQTRDFIFIDDLLEAILLGAVADDVSGEAFQIATNAETTVSELAELLLVALADAGITGVEVHNTAPRLGDVLRNYSDVSKARERLGWRARVQLSEGLRRTVQDFVDGSTAGVDATSRGTMGL